MAFERRLSTNIIYKLKEEHLYSKYLLPDIKDGNVFPAIRKDKISFYYKGGNLFSYDKNGFETNIKYASVSKRMSKGEDETYINEHDLKNVKTIEKFTDEYERIKENCFRYSGVEAVGVSGVCEKYSYVKANSKIVVLDVETSFESIGAKAERRQDRIDLLLLDKRKNILRFYEAKHYSNSEIWSKEGSRPKVVKQISKYNKQVKGKKTQIIEAYNTYTDIVNTLFDLKLNKIDTVDLNVYLLIFGFDRDQLNGRLQRLIKRDKSLEGIYVYPIGSVSSLRNDNLWKCPRKY
jgi:hypothetical protein